MHTWTIGTFNFVLWHLTSETQGPCHGPFSYSFICKFFMNLSLEIHGSESFASWTKDTLEDPMASDPRVQCPSGEAKGQNLVQL